MPALFDSIVLSNSAGSIRCLHAQLAGPAAEVGHGDGQGLGPGPELPALEGPQRRQLPQPVDHLRVMTVIMLINYNSNDGDSNDSDNKAYGAASSRSRRIACS